MRRGQQFANQGWPGSCSPALCAGGISWGSFFATPVALWAPIRYVRGCGGQTAACESVATLHACMSRGGSPPKRTRCGLALYVCVCVCGCVSRCLKCRAGFRHSHTSRMGIFFLLLLPSFRFAPCGTHRHSRYRNRAVFSLESWHAGRTGTPRGLRSAGGTRKGAIISGVLLAGMQHSHVGAVLDLRCWCCSAQRGHFVWK